MTAHPHALVIGLGNEYRSDDAVGRAVARRLTASAGDEFRIKEESGEGGALMEAWKGAEFVVLVDAVESGALPGIICRIDARTKGVPSELFHCSAHAFGVSEAIVSWHARSSDFPLSSSSMALREETPDSRRKWKRRTKSFAA
jgi:hydrogenase maturation protease